MHAMKPRFVDAESMPIESAPTLHRLVNITEYDGDIVEQSLPGQSFDGVRVQSRPCICLWYRKSQDVYHGMASIGPTACG